MNSMSLPNIGDTIRIDYRDRKHNPPVTGILTQWGNHELWMNVDKCKCGAEEHRHYFRLSQKLGMTIRVLSQAGDKEVLALATAEPAIADLLKWEAKHGDKHPRQNAEDRLSKVILDKREHWRAGLRACPNFAPSDH